MMNTDWNPWRSLIVLQVAVLLVGCGVIAAVWRCVEFVIARDQQSQVEQQRFHTESIAALQKLATNAGVLTSADLCLVRFRLRSGEGHTTPSFLGGDTMFQLSARSEGRLEGVMRAAMDTAGTLDFGLNPPGDYQLRLKMPDGMVLLHDFEVLPGVPIDRVIYCPPPAYADDRALRIEIVWPAALEDAPPLAICLIEPASFAHREWEWNPAPDWGPAYALASPFDPDQWERLMEDRMALSDTLLAVERPQIPYVYCQVSEIAFFVESEAGNDAEPRMTQLTTVCFGASDGVRESPVSVGSIWRSDLAPPRCRNLDDRNLIELPDEVIALLQHLMRERR
jgi:hypothetical protein